MLFPPPPSASFPLFFSFLFPFAFPSQNVLSCDYFGWTQLESNCYKMFAFDLNFTQAEDLCQKFAANLTTILSKKEEELVKKIVRDGFNASMGEGKEQRRVAFWVGKRREGEDKGKQNGTNWMEKNGREAQSGQIMFREGVQPPTAGTNVSNGIEMNLTCAGMEPNGAWLHVPCNLSLLGAICKRKAVANLDEGIPYRILLNQTVTGKGPLNITQDKERQMLRTEQNLVEMINNSSDEKGWQAKVHETFAIMSDSSKGHMLGIMEPKRSGRSKRQTSPSQANGGWPIRYYDSLKKQQQLVDYSNKLYRRYASAFQYEYARHYSTPWQLNPQPQTPAYLSPKHMQKLYTEAFAAYDSRTLATALRGYLHYIALAYAQHPSAFPAHYDLRAKFPQCAPWIGLARDQGKCGSCWAVATVAARDDRACIFLALRNYLVFNKNPNQYSSSMDLISCTKEANGCNGGTPKLAWEHLEKYGYLTGEPMVNGSGCKPYVFPPLRMDPEKERKAPECTEHCQAGWKRMAIDRLSGQILPPSNETRYRTVIKTNHWGMDEFEGQVECKNRSKDECYKAMLEGSEKGIMAEIYFFGSVVVTIDVYEDFYRYSSGIYRHTWGDIKGGHAVKLIGWGEEKGPDGALQKYWLGVNSWNIWWGEQGLFKIARGKNESGIEWRAVDVGYIFF